jgi:hypothetical protein
MEDSESTGASIRWAVVGGDDDRMKLQLQALPAPASVLNDKPTLRADNVPVILLEEMPIHCELYDGENMAGPVPTLFGSEEDSLLETIKENLTTVHADLQKLARRFFCPEFIHPKEAAAVVAAPREGTAVYRFRRPKFQPSSNISFSSPLHKKQKTTHVSGRIDPIPTISLSKYSTETDHITKFLESLCITNPETTVHSNGFLNAAYAKATWSKHKSAVNSYTNFCSGEDIDEMWPANLDILKRYIEWAALEKGLSHSSIRSYLSSIRMAHTFMKLDPKVFDHEIIKLMLRGVENTSELTYNPTRKIITIPILKLIGHELACLDWSTYSKQVYWSTCCTAFFGSTRMGEILAETEHKFDPTSTLTWRDLNFGNEKILLHIKNPKIKNAQGDFIDLYKCEGSSYCPVSSILNLRKMAIEEKILNLDEPVFCFANGKNLTVKNFNVILRELLFPHMGTAASEYSCHSFRPSLPSYMAMFPELISKEEIKKQGRWKSSTFELYTRLKSSEKRKLFEKIISILD